jgi:hypothetical protein
MKKHRKTERDLAQSVAFKPVAANVSMSRTRWEGIPGSRDRILNI